MKQFFFKTIGLFSILFFSYQVSAQQTSVMIRAKAKDAKFIGTSIGGAKIFVKDAITGEILDEGFTKGSTGNTDAIMKTPRKRGEDISNEETAGFLASLDISEPVFVTIEAHAPFNKKQATVLSSTQLWVIPGKNITGDGVILIVPGFVIDILSPQTHEGISANNSFEIKANIVMMCGCPVSKEGLWDSSQYEIKALITSASGDKTEIEMQVTKKVSTFSAETKLKKGIYEILVYAYDPVSGNTGLDKTNIIIN